MRAGFCARRLLIVDVLVNFWNKLQDKVMKRLSALLSALLFSASPAIADDFVYLECVTKSVTTTKDLKSNQITKKDETTVTTHFKVDLANSRVQSAKDSQWDETELVNGTYIIDEEWTVNGFTSSMKFSMQLVPPGRITGDGLSRNDSILESSTARGMCKEVVASVFEEALNQ
ncbi:hypothetical protein [Synechococcus sp. MIT S9503]|uniref:hypothetical protein n=1 Tax=Synechococcus sp. MIT S9503 TaxID=3082547 RepID=UPI0039A5923C